MSVVPLASRARNQQQRISFVARRSQHRISRPHGGSGSGLDMSKFVCGYTLVADGKVYMRDGALWDEKWFTWDAAEVVISGATSVITVRYERGVGANYMTPAPSTVLVNDGTYRYFPLFIFQYGVLTGIFHTGALP